jgi:hypothetical protein
VAQAFAYCVKLDLDIIKTFDVRFKSAAKSAESLMMTPIFNSEPSKKDKSFIRFMASASRPLTRDPQTTALSAFDQLLKINKRFAGDWMAIWIVCADGFADVQPHTPLNEAVHLIEKHGGAAGIVGIAMVAQRLNFLKKPLRADKNTRKLLDYAVNQASIINAAADYFVEMQKAQEGEEEGPERSGPPLK